jgi:hypothetical protein
MRCNVNVFEIVIVSRDFEEADLLEFEFITQSA